METTTDELKRLVQIICDHLDEMGHSRITVNAQYYWDISCDELLDLHNEPGELVIGDLDDELGWLRQLLSDEDGALCYHFVWLGSILRAIGATLVG